MSILDAIVTGVVGLIGLCIALPGAISFWRTYRYVRKQRKNRRIVL